MSEQQGSETFLVTLEAFGERRGPWETAAGTREDLERLEGELQWLLRRHAERVRGEPSAGPAADGDDEPSPGHPGPSTGHS